MTNDTANAYLRTQVMTASPAELRLMLIDGAIRFARQGRDGMAARDHEKAFEGLSQAKAIILELINCLRPEVDPELCQRLSALYTYMYRQLIEANLEKNPEMIDEVISLLEYDRETWSMLMKQLAEGEDVPSSGQPAPADSQTDDGAGTPRTPLSVEG